MYLNTPVNIVVLCNNEIAIPALHQLFVSGVLKAVVVPEKNKELIDILNPLIIGSAVKLVNLNRNNLIPRLKSICAETNASSGLLMTFPYIIPESLLNIIPGGFINFHYGLLPKYRGSNPILAQMLKGEMEGGITVHIIDKNVDTGPIVLQQKISIGVNDTFGMQLNKLGLLAASIVPHLLNFYRINPTLPSIAQDISAAQYHEKVTAADLMINWEIMSSHQIIRLINACNPWNKGAGTIINNEVIRFTAGEITDDIIREDLLPGTIISVGENDDLKIICSDKKTITIQIIFTRDGFFTGRKLFEYGIKIKDKFISPKI